MGGARDFSVIAKRKMAKCFAEKGFFIGEMVVGSTLELRPRKILVMTGEAPAEKPGPWAGRYLGRLQQKRVAVD